MTPNDEGLVPVHYELTASELMAFSRAYRRLAPTWISRLYWFGILPVLFVALALAGSVGLATIFTVAFAVSGLFISHWQSKLWYRAFFCSDHVSVQTLPMIATLTEEGARFESAAGHIFYRWQFIREVARVGRHICFTITPIDRQHIPLAAFRDSAHLTEFLTTAQSHIRKRSASPDAASDRSHG
jgi:hypothetical protein